VFPRFFAQGQPRNIKKIVDLLIYKSLFLFCSWCSFGFGEEPYSKLLLKQMLLPLSFGYFQKHNHFNGMV